MQRQALSPVSPLIAHLPRADVCGACVIPALWHGQSQGMVQNLLKELVPFRQGRS